MRLRSESLLQALRCRCGSPHIHAGERGLQSVRDVAQIKPGLSLLRIQAPEAQSRFGHAKYKLRSGDPKEPGMEQSEPR